MRHDTPAPNPQHGVAHLPTQGNPLGDAWYAPFHAWRALPDGRVLAVIVRLYNTTLQLFDAPGQMTVRDGC